MVCKQHVEYEEISSHIKVSGADTARYVSESYSPMLQCLVIYYKRLGTSMLRCYPAKSNLEDGQPLLQSEAKTARVVSVTIYRRGDHCWPIRCHVFSPIERIVLFLMSLQIPGKHIRGCLQLDRKTMSKDCDTPSSRQTTMELSCRS